MLYFRVLNLSIWKRLSLFPTFIIRIFSMETLTYLGPLARALFNWKRIYQSQWTS